MKFHSLHGVLPVEGIIGNDYVVNITLQADTTQAEANDDLDGTINYAIVYDIVKEEMAKPSKLIEHVAKRIEQAVVAKFRNIQKMEVEVQKKRPPVNGEVEYASVTLSYEQQRRRSVVQ